MSRSDRTVACAVCFGTGVTPQNALCGCGAISKSFYTAALAQEQMHSAEAEKATAKAKEESDKREYTGGSVSYYRVNIDAPLSGGDAYTAECNDIIEALCMNYAEGNAFKAIWRSCAARTLGLSKRGYSDGLYDAEKVVFFGGRMIAIRARELEQ